MRRLICIIVLTAIFVIDQNVRIEKEANLKENIAELKGVIAQQQTTIDSFFNRNLQQETTIDSFRSLDYGLRVAVTMYHPDEQNCDDTPDITADGTRLVIGMASEYRYVALSRNLLKRWGGLFDYGDFILVRGIGEKSGVYQVRDTMNSRWVNRVDILETHGVPQYSYRTAEILKVDITTTTN